jgi:hypothetical protein
MCDEDGNGVLDFNELKNAVRNPEVLKVPETTVNDHELKLFFNSMDADGSGGIELDEFLEYLQRGKQSPEEEEKRRLNKLTRIKGFLTVAFKKLGNSTKTRDALVRDIEIAWLQKNGVPRKEISHDEAEEMYKNGHRSDEPVRVPLHFFHEFIRVEMEITPMELKSPDVDRYLKSIGLEDDHFDIEDFLADVYNKPKKNSGPVKVVSVKQYRKTYKQELNKICADMLHKDELPRYIKPSASFTNLGRTAPAVDRWNVSQANSPPRSKRLGRSLSSYDPF